MNLPAIVLTVLAVLLLVPVGIVLLQVLAALPARRSWRASTTPRARLAVLVPAHDEAAGISATVRNIRAQLAEGDRVVVIADNCTDDTAVRAREAGAETIVRIDAERRGKGYALDFGIRHLARNPPAVVGVIDADCRLAEGAIDRLVRRCVQKRRPVQGLDLMHAPAGSGLSLRIAEFAWALKNHLRPLGYLRLGLPCQLQGTGMMFPWETLKGADLGNGHIVEDLRLGLELTRAGHPPLFCPDALVTSMFPHSDEGARSQRTRWEHGHLGMIVREGIPRLFSGVVRADVATVALVLDMCVPPLALLTLAVVATAAAGAAMFALGGSAVPLAVALVAAALLGLAVLLAWHACGRDVVSLADLARAPLYALSKIPLYWRFLFRRQVEWVRSRRDAP